MDNTFTSILYSVQLMSFNLSRKNILLVLWLHIFQKNVIFDICRFSMDLTIYHNTELETMDRMSKIPKISKVLMIFIHLKQYWNIINPDFITNFNFFKSPWHHCFKYVNNYWIKDNNNHIRYHTRNWTTISQRAQCLVD